MIEMIAFNYRKNKTIHWRVFFDHTFDLLNQILLGFIRFYNSSRMPYLRFFLPIRYHQKAILLSIRPQRRKRCGIILTWLERWLANDLEMFSFLGDISFFVLVSFLVAIFLIINLIVSKKLIRNNLLQISTNISHNASFSLD